MCINKNAAPNNNELITYYQRVGYLLRIPQYPVNNTYNTNLDETQFKQCQWKVIWLVKNQAKENVDELTNIWIKESQSVSRKYGFAEFISKRGAMKHQILTKVVFVDFCRNTLSSKSMLTSNLAYIDHYF